MIGRNALPRRIETCLLSITDPTRVTKPVRHDMAFFRVAFNLVALLGGVWRAVWVSRVVFGLAQLLKHVNVASKAGVVMGLF